MNGTKRSVFVDMKSVIALLFVVCSGSVYAAKKKVDKSITNKVFFDIEQWPDFGCEGIKVQRAHQPTSQCQGKKKKKVVIADSGELPVEKAEDQEETAEL
eukprot:TRINITY_DN28772_c0_g1_i4.p3 TRINITY_DN28772_c0_g1~~TRINITY_DN28772_c0_g1_i4.p3  ORF type:complete len:100 (+),score=32.45 TRINITY_DN28772_c0_g1_i4:75-374(+)